MEQFHGTTILSVRRPGQVALGGDGQVSLGLEAAARVFDQQDQNRNQRKRHGRYQGRQDIGQQVGYCPTTVHPKHQCGAW